MKIFGKGGKFNIIDVLVVLILVAAVVFVVMKLLPNNSSDADGDLQGASALSEPNLRFTVVCQDLDSTVAQAYMDALSDEPVSLKSSSDSAEAQRNAATVAPTRLYNNNAFVDAQITQFYTEPIEGSAEGKVNFYATVEANAHILDGVCTVGSQELRIGKSIFLKTINFELSTIVLSMELLG